MTSLVLNQELNGVELYFDSKPIKQILETLKSNGFRWSNYKKCWYAKQNKKVLKLAEQLTKEEITSEVITEVKETIKKDSKINLWKLTRITEFEVNSKLSVKEIAAEVRKHVKNRFPMCKFSVTSSRHNSISFHIATSPYEKESIYLKAIEKYCTALLEAYNYCTCYDPYGDYGSSYNFYGAYAKISYDYIQTEQSEEIKADLIEFDNRLKEFEKAEEERKEIEFQEYQKKQEEENKKYQERLKEEKKEIETINNNVNVIELENNNQYFILGSQFAHLNKNNTLEEYKEEVKKEAFNLENVKIFREIHFKTEEALNYFSNLLLHDFDFINGGGSYTEDKRFTSMSDFYNMEKEERESIIWITKGIAVYFNNELKFIVNAEGYNYARYVGLCDNVTITKDYNIKQFINNAELEELKNKAETLTDLSVEVITDNNLVNSWNSENWNEYKEFMKEKFKNNNFRLTKEIIQQLPEDSEKLKVAMYKLLKEVDGIQEQFKNADINQGDKLTLFYISSFGSIVTSRIIFDSVEYKEYAQYKNAVKLIFKPENKRKLHYNYFYKELIVYNGWLDLPEEVLHTIEHKNNGITITRTKYLSCDNKQYDAIIEHFAADNIKPIINTYKPIF